MEEEVEEKPKRVPVSLEEVLAKKKAEEEAQSKVSLQNIFCSLFLSSYNIHLSVTGIVGAILHAKLHQMVKISTMILLLIIYWPILKCRDSLQICIN